MLKIQQMLSVSVFEFETAHEKLIIVKNVVFYLKKRNIQNTIFDVLLDYYFESRISFEQIIFRFEQHFVKRIYNFRIQKMKSLNQSHSVRNEFELTTYTRRHFIENFDKKIQKSCFFFSFLTFIDDFDLYRNMYRILMRMYMIFANFFFKKRIRRFNVLSLILESHESNFADIVAVLQSLLANLKVDESLTFDDEKKVFLCAFTLCFLNDMFQQNENFEFLNQRINLECRFCFVQVKERNNIEYDTFRNERFHHEIIRIRKHMSTMKKTQQMIYDRETELNANKSSLFFFFFAFDIILIRSNDSAHSEYDDIIKFLHILLMTAILTFNAQKDYFDTLRCFVYFFD